MIKLSDLVKKSDLAVRLFFFIKTMILNLKYYKKDVRIHFSAILNNTFFLGYNRIHKNTEIYNSTLDSFTYVSYDTIIQNSNIGKFCSIGPDCKIGLGKHPTRSFVSSHPIFFSKNSQFRIRFCEESEFSEFDEINIGNDVWIGAGAIILDGVRIGDGAIIGAGSVVTKDIEPYSINKGVPSEKIRSRFEEPDILFLQSLKWWDLDVNLLKSKHSLFSDIELIKAEFGHLVL